VTRRRIKPTAFSGFERAALRRPALQKAFASLIVLVGIGMLVDSFD
jgi:hypothetical protein